MTVTAPWPRVLWIVRHGQSAGNIAADLAHLSGQGVLEVAGRDADVPLSALGERQSHALGRWFAQREKAERPTGLLTSPYLRARRTALIVAEELGGGLEVLDDERLRERELGAFDRLTHKGWTERFPEQALLRASLGKFYHRPPGGESWCDVVLRLRTLVHDIQTRYVGERLLVVGHQVIVLCLRYILERLNEATILRIDAAAAVANCGVTAYVAPNEMDARGRPLLVLDNHVAPVADAGETVTSATDEPSGAR
jgi:probable phosphoglycerate mutase